MFTKLFWISALERAVKSFVQGFTVVGGVISPDGFMSADSFKGAFGLAFASFLTSVASSFKGDSDSPSLV